MLRETAEQFRERCGGVDKLSTPPQSLRRRSLSGYLYARVSGSIIVVLRYRSEHMNSAAQSAPPPRHSYLAAGQVGGRLSLPDLEGRIGGHGGVESGAR